MVLLYHICGSGSLRLEFTNNFKKVLASFPKLPAFGGQRIAASLGAVVALDLLFLEVLGPQPGANFSKASSDGAVVSPVIPADAVDGAALVEASENIDIVHAQVLQQVRSEVEAVCVRFRGEVHALHQRV